MIHSAKDFDLRNLQLEARRPSGVDEARWRGMSQAARLEHRFQAMQPSQRSMAQELLTMCPGSVGRDDWLAMTGDERIWAMKASALPPESCGQDIAASIARGPFAVFQAVEMIPDEKSARGFKAAPNGYRGRDSLRAVDVFDRMGAYAKRAKKEPPLTQGQIAIARHYRDLTERHDAGGMKLASLEGRTGGDGSGRDFMDAFLAEGRELTALHRRIGVGVAMEVRRVRPSARGAGAGIITDRALVDAVCLGDKTPAEVLRSFGWSEKGQHRDMLRAALRDALDRMQCY